MACIQTPQSVISSLNVFSGAQVVYKDHNADHGQEAPNAHCCVYAALPSLHFATKEDLLSKELTRKQKS